MINNSLIQINSNSKEQSARNSVTDANSIKKKPSLYQKKSFIFEKGITSKYQSLFPRIGKKTALSADSINLNEEDIEKRTIIHRACYQLKYDLINEMKDQMKTEDVNKLDKYGNSPLILACKTPLKEGSTIRKDIIKILLSKKAYIHTTEPINGWSALHWACFNGDLEAVKILIDNGAIFFLPCNNGHFTIDLAGKKHYADIVSYIINECVSLLDTVGQFDILDPVQLKLGRREVHTEENEDKNEQEDNLFNHIKKLTEQREKEEENNEDNDDYYDKLVNVELRLLSPFTQTIFLRCFLNHCLYWGSYYHLSEKIINKLIVQYKASPIQELYCLNNQTPLHSSCAKGNITALELMIKEYDNMKLKANKSIVNTGVGSYFIKNKKLSVIQLLRKISEMKKDQNFKKLNQKFRKYLSSNAIILFYPDERINIKPLLEITDNYGDIPFNCAPKYSQNFFMSKIKDLNLIQDIDQHLSITNKYGMSGYYLLKDDELQEYFLSKAKKKLYPIPPVVIELNKNKKTISTINLVMKIALAENLKATLMEHKNPDNLYLLVDIGIKEFCEQAEKEKIQMKLLDKNLKVSFINSEEFVKKVEPFLSRHYQTIISSILNNLIDIEMLQSQSIINKVFYTHKPNVTQKIMDTIIKRIIPNPIAFFPDYFLEGKTRIFKEIDLLYRYFGEASATFYSFYGYITNCYVILAIVGLIYVFIYLASLFRSDEIYPTFCIIFAIWNLVFISRWKRKNEEIHHKWGLKTKVSKREIRSQFKGDEYYKDLDGPLQKHVKKYSTLKIFLCSLPLIIILLAADVVVFYYTTKWEDDTEDNPSLIFQYLPSIVRSIGLSIISYIYDFVANYFAEKENHKFQDVYDKTLIVKIFSFRLIADLTSVLYSSLVQKNIQNLKVLLYTNLIIKYICEIGVRVCLPFVKQWFFQRQYFKYVQSKTKEYKDKDTPEQLKPVSTGGPLIDNEQDKLKVDNNQNSNEIKYSNSKIEGKDIQIITVQNAISDSNMYRRVNCITGKPLKDTNQSSFNFNPDFIEITNMLDTRTNLIYDYADIIIVHTLCSLFAILIPFGPVIVLVFSILSQNGKLYGDLYFFQRAPAKECDGIGIWLDILEIISTLSVVFNCFLFYFYGENYLTDQLITSGTEIDVGKGEKSLFILVASEHVIILIQYLLKISIPSVPTWVQKEKENLMNYYQNDKIEKEMKSNKELNDEIIKYQKIYNEKIRLLQEECDNKDKAIKQYQKEMETYKEEIFNKEEKLDASLNTINKLLGNKTDNHKNKLKFPRLRHLKSGRDANKEQEEELIDESDNDTLDQNLFLTYSIVKNEIDIHFDESLNKIVREMLLAQKTVMLSEIETNTRNVMKVYFFTLLKNTFDKVEKELLAMKFSKCINNIDHPLIICDICLEKRANYLCQNCQEMLCDKCKGDHLLNSMWSNHEITVYTLPYYLSKNEKLEQNFTERDLMYVKMENFSFPTKISKNLGYEKLNSIYELLYKEYIIKNGILQDNTINSKNIIQMKMELLTKLSSSPNKALSEEIEELIKKSFFNCEEFFYINRICYKIFKFYGAKSNIGMVYSTLKKFQVCNYEEKILTLLNILDIYDNQTIFKSEVEKFFVLITLQNYTEKYSINSLLEYIFPHSNFISLKELYQILIKNEVLSPLMKYILQCEDEDEKEEAIDLNNENNI